MPDLERYSRGWGMVDNVPAIGTDIERDRHGAAAGRLHQMRPDLGRLAAEIMQIGSSIAQPPATLGAAPGAMCQSLLAQCTS